MRRKITEPDKLAAADDLPALTEQQMRFVELVLSGKRVTEAYRAAYDCSNMVQTTVWAAASRLHTDCKISAWIAAARKAQFGSAVRTKEQHILRLAELAQIAIDTGNVGAAVQAEQLIGKVEGHYTERVEMNITDPMQTLREIAQMSPALAAALAKDQGIEWQSDTQH